MAEFMALRAVSWITVKAVEHFLEFFMDEAGGLVFSWNKSLQKLTSTIEYRAVTGMHQDLREGTTALTAAISAVRANQVEGTETIVRQLVELRKSQHLDEQEAYLKRAVDAMEDVWGVRYPKGNPKNVGLLEIAYKNAESAARATHGTLATRIQAYRIWVVTAYMHEKMTATPESAKAEAMYIVGRVIFSDPDLLKICAAYAGCNDVADEPLGDESTETGVATVTRPWTGEAGTPSDISSVDPPAVIDFVLEITSSVCMLPPHDQGLSCKHVMEVVGAGMKLGDDGQMELRMGEISLGRGAPDRVILAMGKYCASRCEAAQLYPTVSAFALSAWEKNKERLALDNFYRSMGGKNWIFSHGWEEKGGELRHRYGVAVEDGHVTKICLATNNLHGCLQPDLVDCEHLRELVLHDNNISGVVPRGLQRLIDRNPRMITTGLPLLRVTEDEQTTASCSLSRSASLSDTSCRAGRVSTVRSGSTSSYTSIRGFSGSVSMESNEPLSDAASDGLSGVSSIRRNKKGSFIKRAISSIKETVKPGASAACAPECTFCAGKNLRGGQDGPSIVSPDCP